jgi:hypothetical protein
MKSLERGARDASCGSPFADVVRGPRSHAGRGVTVVTAAAAKEAADDGE